MADWIPLPRSQWDELRLPFPGFTPKRAGGATYTISLAGIVRRNDGVVWQPTAKKSKHGITTSLVVRLGGGQSSRSLAKSMHMAFAESTPIPDPDRLWIPWLMVSEVDGRTDELSCSIDYVEYVPFRQVLDWTRGKRPYPPTSRRLVAIGRDIPIPAELLCASGYTFGHRDAYAQREDADGFHKIDKVHIR